MLDILSLELLLQQYRNQPQIKWYTPDPPHIKTLRRIIYNHHEDHDPLSLEEMQSLVDVFKDNMTLYCTLCTMPRRIDDNQVFLYLSNLNAALAVMRLVAAAEFFVYNDTVNLSNFLLDNAWTAQRVVDTLTLLQTHKLLTHSNITLMVTPHTIHGSNQQTYYSDLTLLNQIYRLFPADETVTLKQKQEIFTFFFTERVKVRELLTLFENFKDHKMLNTVTVKMILDVKENPKNLCFVMKYLKSHKILSLENLQTAAPLLQKSQLTQKDLSSLFGHLEKSVVKKTRASQLHWFLHLSAAPAVLNSGSSNKNRSVIKRRLSI